MASIIHRRYFVIYIFLTVLHLCRATEKEKTLAMIKPEGLAGNYSDNIKNMVLSSGFSILKEMVTRLDEDTARSFYVEHSNKNFFPSLIKYMTSGPVLIMVLEKHNAVSDWRNLIGPTDAGKAKVTHPHSIRAMCGISTERNCVHGSDSTKSASREISFFFGIGCVHQTLLLSLIPLLWELLSGSNEALSLLLLYPVTFGGKKDSSRTSHDEL